MYTDRLSFGEIEGINLSLTRHYEYEGKHYYFLNRSGDHNFTLGGFMADDQVSGFELDSLFNIGGHTDATQEGDHDGTDDIRSRVLPGYTLILPTQQELNNLFTNLNYDTLSRQVSRIFPHAYRVADIHTLDPGGIDTAHHVAGLPNLSDSQALDWGYWWVILQVKANSSFNTPHLDKVTLSRVTLSESQTSTVKIIFDGPIFNFSVSNITDANNTISDFVRLPDGGKSYQVTLTPNVVDNFEYYLEVDLHGVRSAISPAPLAPEVIHGMDYRVNTLPPSPSSTAIDTIPEWPDILPAPSQTSYEIKPVPSFRRTEMTSGIARQRRVTRNPPTTFTMFWDMSKSEFAVFEAFFIYDLHDGRDWFKMDYATGIGCVEGEFRFTNVDKPYTAEAITSESFRIRTILELRYRNILSRADFAAQVNMNLVLPIWPTNLPVPLVRSYKIEPKSSVYRTLLKQGYANYRAVQNNETTIFQMRWHMTNEQFALFQAFYQYNLNDGQSWFYMDHAEGIGFVGGEFRFFERSFTYRAQYMSENYFSVDAKIERRGKKLMYRDTYNIITCPDKTIKDFVFDDAYNRLHIYLHHTLPSIQGEW